MTEELGKIEKPSSSDFKPRRRLYFVPLVFAPPAEPELSEIIDRYWQQAGRQVANLEERLGPVQKVFHELVPSGGQDGLKAIKDLNKGSFEIVKARLENGAELQPIEDAELLTEFMDWGRCLASGLQNRKVAGQIYDSYVEAQKKRNSEIARRIDESLHESETGLLLMREGHQIQFPTDIEVFYIAPPALDEVNRWLRKREG